MNIIETKNLNYETSKKVLFNNVNLNIESGSFVSIIGENGVGKTTLLKLLSGSIISDNNIKIDNKEVNRFNVEEINKKSIYINSYNEYFSKTVMNEIMQDKKSVSIFEMNKVKKLLDEFNLLYLEDMSPQNLSYAENQIIALIKAIIKEPKIIFLDNAFSKLDNDKRRELLSYINKYALEHDITIVSTTNKIEDLIFSDRIIVLKNKGIAFDGSYEELLEDNIIKNILKLPFEIEVSDKLMMYDLLDKRYESIDDMVGELCK